MKCPNCHGTGWVWVRIPLLSIPLSETPLYDVRHNRRDEARLLPKSIEQRECPECGGSGIVSRRDTAGENA